MTVSRIANRVVLLVIAVIRETGIAGQRRRSTGIRGAKS